MTKKLGIIAYVCRQTRTGVFAGKCGGISDEVDEIVIVGPGIDGIFEATPTRPAFELVQHVSGCVSLRPVDGPKSKHQVIGPMFGGNFATASDSRITSAVEKLLGRRFYGAIAIHDRYETQAQYNLLST